MSKRVHVVAGIIYRDGQILLAKRPQDKHQGGLWEFPGGKVEPLETPASALKRELKEEVNLTVVSAKPYAQISHDYSDKLVQLDFYWLEDFTGEPTGLEGQELRWVPVSELSTYAFPEANTPIVKQLMSAQPSQL